MKTALLVVIAGLSIISAVVASSVVATRQADVEESIVQQVTSEQVGKWGLDIGKPNEKAILMAWAECAKIEDFVVPKCSVDSFKKIQLSGGKRGGLAAFINRNSTSDPVDLFIIVESGKGFFCQQLKTQRGQIEDIADLAKPGTTDIVVRSAIQSGSHANAFYWPDIYSWSDKGFVKNSPAFLQSYYVPIYLEQVSERMEHATETLNGRATETERKEALAMLKDCREGLNRVLSLAKESHATPADK